MDNTPPLEFKHKAIAFLIVIGFMYFVYSKISGCGQPSTATTPIEKFSKVNAYVDCQEKVKLRLKSPASAEFETSYEDAVKQINDSIFEISSYVDSQNGYGAMLRTRFHCKLIYHDYNNTIEYKSFNLHGQ